MAFITVHTAERNDSWWIIFIPCLRDVIIESIYTKSRWGLDDCYRRNWREARPGEIPDEVIRHTTEAAQKIAVVAESLRLSAVLLEGWEFNRSSDLFWLRCRYYEDGVRPGRMVQNLGTWAGVPMIWGTPVPPFGDI